MPPSIPALDITEGYDALTILRESQLNAAMTSIEDYINDNLVNDIVQMALDVFGTTYELNHDGIATFTTPLVDLIATLDDNETITGSWTFDGPVAFGDTVTSTSTFTSTAQPRARAYRSTSNQSIANTTLTVVSFNSETYDTQSMHDNSTNPSRITIPTGGGGVYEINAQVTFDNNNTGRREVHIYKGGSSIAKRQLFNPDATEDSVVGISIQEAANAGDYFEIYVYQSSGGALDLVFGERISFFSVLKVW